MTSSTGEAVKTLRTELGISQKALADRVGVSQQTIARWEGGGEIPTKHLPDLAMTLGTSVAALVSGGEPHSYLTRWVRPRQGQHKQHPEPELLFGTLRLRFLPSLRELLNPQPEVENRWPKPFEREYAVSNGERRRLSVRLDDRRELRTGNWFGFESLDNRLVFVNRSQIESVELVSDDIESTPPWEDEEIYRALSDPAVRDALISTKPFEIFSGEDALYSEMTIRRCFDLAEKVGNLERLFDSIDYIYAQAIDGRELELVSDPLEETLSELNLLDIQLDGISTKDDTPVDDWLVELGAEGWERSSLYRLGSLRVIEAPLLKYREYWERQWAESADLEQTNDNQEGRDG
jgi:transcriptional regulator with XRE-family HTH domain